MVQQYIAADAVSCILLVFTFVPGQLLHLLTLHCAASFCSAPAFHLALTLHSVHAEVYESIPTTVSCVLNSTIRLQLLTLLTLMLQRQLQSCKSRSQQMRNTLLSSCTCWGWMHRMATALTGMPMLSQTATAARGTLRGGALRPLKTYCRPGSLRLTARRHTPLSRHKLAYP